ncbi:MAG: FtsQ-type POTRA domain-containing protein, partial [Oscillospiraceae bacterium]|nr:FtsQ-type POTRA domain-containing protein [Oscillospiraceae bacterium]
MAKRDKTANTRKRRSKRRYTLYYLLAFVLVVAVGLVMSLTVFFEITTINVSGNTMYADNEIIALSGIMTGDNLIRVPARKIESKIVESYPYIKTADVKRVLPDSVTIHITMAEEAAALRKADGRFMLVSPEGRVLKSDIPLCPEEMIPVDGFELPVVFDGDDLFIWEYEENGKTVIEENTAEKERFERLLELQAKIAENNLASDIKVIDMSDMLDIRMLY